MSLQQQQPKTMLCPVKISGRSLGIFLPAALLPMVGKSCVNILQVGHSLNPQLFEVSCGRDVEIC